MIHKRLEKKGWEKKHVLKVKRTFEDVHRSRPDHIKAMDHMGYVLALVVAVISALAVSFVLVPVLLLLPSWIMYPMIVIVGLSFGSLVSHALRNAEHYQKGHHIGAGLVMAFSAIVSFLLISYFSHRFGTTVLAYLGIDLLRHNNFLAAGVFAFAFIAPYLFFRFEDLER